jgi:hypothetical protein
LLVSTASFTSPFDTVLSKWLSEVLVFALVLLDTICPSLLLAAIDRLESPKELELPLESVRGFKVTLEPIKEIDLVVEALEPTEVLSTKCVLEESVLT